ncbi:MAG: hypothetical protein H6Q39_1502 [Chloroflexi bacterium]|nr:hypothetical protein [Chloroflexota bacterium]
MTTTLGKPPLEETVYESRAAFKKDLELNLWCHFENAFWLKIKPRKALPWYGSDMEATLSRILKY